MITTYVRKTFAKPVTDFGLDGLDVDETVRGHLYKGQ